MARIACLDVLPCLAYKRFDMCSDGSHAVIQLIQSLRVAVSRSNSKVKPADAGYAWGRDRSAQTYSIVKVLCWVMACSVNNYQVA